MEVRAKMNEKRRIIEKSLDNAPNMLLIKPKPKIKR
jgi:hypothetical protein